LDNIDKTVRQKGKTTIIKILIYIYNKNVNKEKKNNSLIKTDINKNGYKKR
jgi:hypothetical protein